MLWWQLQRPLQITWFGVKDGTFSWRRALTSICPSCCQRGDTPATLWEESLPDLGNFWSQSAEKVWNICKEWACENIGLTNVLYLRLIHLKLTLYDWNHPPLPGLCSLRSQPNSKGDWTVYFSEPASSAESANLVRKDTDCVLLFHMCWYIILL